MSTRKPESHTTQVLEQVIIENKKGINSTFEIVRGSKVKETSERLKKRV